MVVSAANPTIPACPVTQASSGAGSDAGCGEVLRVVWVGIAALTPPYALIVLSYDRTARCVPSMRSIQKIWKYIAINGTIDPTTLPVELLTESSVKTNTSHTQAALSGLIRRPIANPQRFKAKNFMVERTHG